MNRISLRHFLALTILLMFTSNVCMAGDTSELKPPKGSKVAILVFEDLECPQCARMAPLLHDAAKQYNIPLVQYDFPLPMHPWSFQAAVYARYFDTQSKKLGDDYRLFIFRNQPTITRDNLRGYTDRFAADNKVSVPFVLDPQGDLAGKVKADAALGNRVGITETPTIYIASVGTANPLVKVGVQDTSQLYTVIDQTLKEANQKSAPKKTTTAHKTSTAQ